MPVSSEDRVIEKYISNINVKVPSEWAMIIRNASDVKSLLK